MLGLLGALLLFVSQGLLMDGLDWISRISSPRPRADDFMMLYQDRLYTLLNVFALRSIVLAFSVGCAHIQTLHNSIYNRDRARLQASSSRSRCITSSISCNHREIEAVIGIGPTMVLGIGFVALSLAVMLRVTAEADRLAREDVALALSVVLLRTAHDGDAAERGQPGGWLHVDGERPDPGGDRCQGHAVRGRDERRFSVLVAFVVIGIFLFRIRERFDTVDAQALDRFRRTQE